MISNFYKGCDVPPYTISNGLSEFSYLKNGPQEDPLSYIGIIVEKSGNIV